MTTQVTKAADRPPMMLIIVSASDKPNRLAGVFSGDEAQQAKKLAQDVGHHAIEVVEPKLRELWGRLAPGKITNNTLTLSAIANAMKTDVEKILVEHKKLVAPAPIATPSAAKQDEASKVAAAATSVGFAKLPQPTTVSPPASVSKPSASNRDGTTPSFVKEAFWNELEVGDLVLSIDFDSRGKPDGWYEAIIVSIEGNKCTLRWRDYPEEGLRTRTREQFAFMHPKA